MISSITREKIKSFIDFSSEIKGIAFIDGYYTVPVSEEPTLTKFKIDGELYDANIRLQLKKFFSETSVKYNQLLTSELKSEEINSEFLVIDAVKKSVVLFHEGIFEQFGILDIEILSYVKNTVSYFKLFNFLKSNDFCDYFNSANNQIVVYSSAKGVYKINYETIPEIPNDNDIEKNIVEFIKNADPIELRPYFKSSIFAFTNGKGFVHLNEVINNSTEIIFSALRDHDLVLKQFDFENFKNSLYKEKEKYFTNIREIINKIFSQAVGIPVSISAAVFATYKVSDDSFMLLLVMLSFIVYVVFYVKIQWVYRTEIKEIETDFNKDFNIIASESGLQQEIILKEKVKIEAKISSSLIIVNWLISTVVLLGLLVCLYIYYEIGKSEAFSLFKLILKIL